ncbi:unnamed protein product [Malus baccata var. baccata]
MGAKKLHVAMYPWFAMGHLTSFLHISNKLAERGHRISFFIPVKTLQKLEAFNLYPDRIAFIPINVPHVPGLPPGTETTADVPFPLHSLLMTAMDLTRPEIGQALRELKPDFVFFDFTQWMPELLHELDMGTKSIHYCTISPATVLYLSTPERNLMEKQPTVADLMLPPPSFPASSITLRTHEARGLVDVMLKEFGRGVTFMQRQFRSFSGCDAIAFKTCREIEGPYCDYIGTQLRKPVFLAGPVVPETPTKELDEKWSKWLEGFEAKSMIYCAFGSECILKIDQFQELLLGFEITGLPFFAALKPPMGAESIESALPELFAERTRERGVVYGGWVQQPLFLRHPSVGCFVTHCGSGSLSEALVNECQLVLLPNVGDQIINARVMSRDLKVGVEVEKGDLDGLFTKEGVSKAVEAVMEDGGEVAEEVRSNHAKWRDFLCRKELENSYLNSFEQKLHQLLE